MIKYAHFLFISIFFIYIYVDSNLKEAYHVGIYSSQI